MSEKIQSKLSDPLYWQNLIRNAFNITVNALRSFPALIPTIPGKIKSGTISYFKELQINSRLRFQTIAITIAWLIIAISILSASNPYKLLLPGGVFAFPHLESRTLTKQYGLKKDSNEIVALERYFQGDKSIVTTIRRIGGIIQTPVHFKDRQPGSQIIEVEPLPGFSNAIVHIWYLKNDSRVLIDLRSITLEDELDKYLANAPVSEEKRLMYLDSWFLALTASILEMQDSRIKTVEYRLDGKKQDYPNMKFLLSAAYN